MAKTDPKTMRFDEDVYDYVMAYKDGDDFTKKFHNMVHWIRNSEQDRQFALDYLEVQIKRAKGDLAILEQKTRAYKVIKHDFDALIQSIDKITMNVSVIQNCTAAS